VIADEGGTGDRYKINEKTQLGPLPSIPPGFTRGLKIKSTDEDADLENTELDDEEGTEEVVRSVHVNKLPPSTTKQHAVNTGFEGIDDLLPEEVPPLLISLMKVPTASTTRTTALLPPSKRQRVGPRRRCKPRNDKLPRTNPRNGPPSSLLQLSFILIVVPLRTGQFPKRSSVPSRERGLCVCRSTYLSR
jgi:hypothetical protein